ncbi:MAG TPA: hypothetical protein VEB43_07735 [Anaeromyxobacter sp.]|nr:hypothetical protein [Anaeromyxobacter sp.]
MKKVMLAAVLGLVLSACGGEGGGVKWRDPDSFDPQFGSPSSSLTEAEQTAAQSLTTSVSNAVAFPDTEDAATADAQAMAAANLPNDMGNVFGDVPSYEATVTAQARAFASGAALEAAPVWDNPECWTVTARRVLYDNCTQTTTDVEEGVTTVYRIDGSLQAAIDAGTQDRTVTWDVTISVRMSNASASLTFSDRYRGTITFSPTARTYVGDSRSDIYIAMSAEGFSEEAALTYHAEFDLAYTADAPPCVNSGTLTLKRFASEIPSGMEDDPRYQDAAVRFTWTDACGAGSVQVARQL